MISDIDKLFEKGQVSHHLLVIIDSTIGLTDEGKIEEFVAHNSSRINDLKMSVIDMRSLQKVDQVGLDMYSGGLMAVYSKRPPFLQSFAAEDEETSFSRANLQGIMHFMKNVQPELDERRAAIMKVANSNGRLKGGKSYNISLENLKLILQHQPRDR